MRTRALELVRLGFGVMKRTVPPSELAPYSVPCGPRSTSTRSISNSFGVGSAEKLDFAACTGVSSMYTPTVASPAAEEMPRITMEGAPPLVAACTLNPGISRAKPARSFAPICSRCASLSAEMLIGTRLSFSSRFWAVTTISSSPNAAGLDSVGGSARCWAKLEVHPRHAAIAAGTLNDRCVLNAERTDFIADLRLPFHAWTSPRGVAVALGISRSLGADDGQIS